MAGVRRVVKATCTTLASCSTRSRIKSKTYLIYYTLKILFRNIWLSWLSQSKRFLTPDLPDEGRCGPWCLRSLKLDWTDDWSHVWTSTLWLRQREEGNCSLRCNRDTQAHFIKRCINESFYPECPSRYTIPPSTAGWWIKCWLESPGCVCVCVCAVIVSVVAEDTRDRRETQNRHSGRQS